ncbi:MAG: hypothetical protein KGI06_04535 [Candidatus Micrarchaeota archaeon]|nr:hypothetical protein [Candidatus Micrarchaeota archaeon]
MELIPYSLQRIRIGVPRSRAHASNIRSIDVKTQHRLASSQDHWTMVSLAHNPSIHQSVQKRFVERFQEIGVEEFIGTSVSLNRKLKAKNFIVVMNRLSANPKLHPELHKSMVDSVIRLDDEISSSIGNQEISEFNREVILRWLQSDTHSIAANLVNNPCVEDAALKERLSEHFKI